jgi:hypothetical protein
MSKTLFFALSVQDHITGKTYQFDACIKEDEIYHELYIATRLDSCVDIVHIVIGQDEEASLSDLSEGISGILLKGSLKYVIQRFPHIRRVSLQDVSKETPVRLLTGEPGWYEERLGAKPTMKTQVLKRSLKKQPTNISLLLGTTWDILKATIEDYPVSILHIQTNHENDWLDEAKRRKEQNGRALGQIALLTQMDFMEKQKERERNL